MSSINLQTLALTALSFSSAYAQQAGTLTAENHPALTIQECTDSGCTSQARSVVLDSNWRWLHSTEGSTNCYTGNTWDATLCPDPTTCAENCALEGADYPGTYGISASGDSLAMTLVTGSNSGSRVYLLGPDGENYQMFNMKNKEFAFTVDVSELPCGLNGALYFVEMDADGGEARFPTNSAGAEYGTGYCDAQCPRDIKFINGEANMIGWSGSDNNDNTGTGSYGACCAEMDLWEANSISTAYTPHTCADEGQTRCDSDVSCGTGAGNRYAGVCDKDGCDFNPYRQGNRTYYGPSEEFVVDTTREFTVVTQFLTADGTEDGDLIEIRRLYVQDGEVIANAVSNVEGIDAGDSLTDEFCAQQKEVFIDTNGFEARGGMAGMGDAFQRGMVLVMSIWNDYEARMLWLDSVAYPIDADPSVPGVARGTCPTDSGVPEEVEAQYPDATVVLSDIRYGPLDSTY